MGRFMNFNSDGISHSRKLRAAFGVMIGVLRLECRLDVVL